MANTNRFPPFFLFHPNRINDLHQFCLLAITVGMPCTSIALHVYVNCLTRLRHLPHVPFPPSSPPFPAFIVSILNIHYPQFSTLIAINVIINRQKKAKGKRR